MRRLAGDERSRPTYVSDPTNSATDTNTATSVSWRSMSVLDVDDFPDDHGPDDLKSYRANDHALAHRVVQEQLSRFGVDREEHQRQHWGNAHENPPGNAAVRGDHANL